MLHLERHRTWEIWAIIAGAAGILALVWWAASRWVDPAPPKVVVMATGQPGGAYAQIAKRYQEILARERVRLEIQFSDGSLDNLRRLTDRGGKVAIAFVQSGVATASGIDTGSLGALGGLYYEPLWIFYRAAASIDQLRALKGKRVAVGPQGSGTRLLALQLLEASGIAGSMELSELAGNEAAQALSASRIDAVVTIGAPDAPLVKALLHEPSVRLMSFAHAEAYTRLFPFLSRLVLPRGLIDLDRDLPAEDVQLLAATATLVAREDTHPALINLFLGAAAEIHGKPGWFQKSGEFPAAKGVDIALSDDAARYFKRNGPPFFQRYLPFHIAVLVERLLVLALPLLAVLVPMLRYLPPLYTWRARRRVYLWYRDLRQVEKELATAATPAQIGERQRELDRVEQEVSQVRVPLSYNNELYWLREHIQFVRNEIRQRLEQTGG